MASSIRLMRAPVVAAVAAMGLAAAAWFWLEPAATPSVAVETTTRHLEPAALTGPADSAVAVSRDGTFVVFAARALSTTGGVTLLRTGALAGTPVALFDPAPGIEPQSPFVAPDGQWVGFISGGRLMKVPAAGGTPLTVCDCAASSRGGATWLQDGSIVFRTGNHLRIVAADGRQRRDLTRVAVRAGERAHGSPAAAPRPNLLTFTVLTDDPQTSSVMLLDMKTGSLRLLRQGARFGKWVGSDVLVYLDAAGHVRATHIDFRTLAPVGSDLELDLGPVYWSRDTAGFDVAADGTLAFATGEEVTHGRSLWWVARSGLESQAPLLPRGYTYPRISPDGHMVALDVRDENFNVWLWQLQDNSLRPLTQGRRNGYPAWLPDSRALLISSDRDGVDAVFSLSPGSSTPWRPFASSTWPLLPYAVTSDGLRAVLRQTGSQRSLLTVTSTTGDGRLDPITTIERYALNAVLSPDGHWLAYQAGDAARTEVYVQPLLGPVSSRIQVSTGGGLMPLWSHSGTELFYVDANHELMRVPVAMEGSRVTPGTPLRFFAEPYSSAGWFHGPNGRTFDLTPDGERFLVIKDEVEREGRQERPVRLRRAATAGLAPLSWRERIMVRVSRRRAS